MLTIRLSRIGKKNKPMYRLIISEKARDTQGRALEILGSYNPYTKDLQTKKDRIEYWLSQGAQMSATVNNLLIEKSVIKGEKVKASKARINKKDKEKTEEKSKAESKPKKEGKPKTEDKEKKPETEQEQKAEEKPKEEQPKEVEVKDLPAQAGEKVEEKQPARNAKASNADGSEEPKSEEESKKEAKKE